MIMDTGTSLEFFFYIQLNAKSIESAKRAKTELT